MAITYTWKPIGKAKHRMEPAFWDPKYDALEAAIFDTGWEVKELGGFITSITYGQVGRRIYDPNGEVRYIQSRNIVSTGIDFLARPGRIAEGSHNDPERSRVKVGDILYINSGIGSLGRCVCITNNHGKVNVSQHIDVICVEGIKPEYVATYLMSGLGQLCSRRASHGVSRMIGISFDEVKSIPIPVLPSQVQGHVVERYKHLGKLHDAAMEAKAAGNEVEHKEKLTYAQQLLAELVEYVEKTIRLGPQSLGSSQDA